MTERIDHRQGRIHTSSHRDEHCGRRQELEEDGDQQTSAAAMYGRESGIRGLRSSFVVQEEMSMIESLHLSGKGAGVFGDGLIEWIRQRTLFKLVEPGVVKASSKWTRGLQLIAKTGKLRT